MQFTMRSPAILLLLPLALAIPSAALVNNRANPSLTTEVQDGQTGTLIVVPPQATETGLKQIPGKLKNLCLTLDLNCISRCRPSVHCSGP
jgi:hypothetical protein